MVPRFLQTIYSPPNTSSVPQRKSDWEWLTDHDFTAHSWRDHLYFSSNLETLRSFTAADWLMSVEKSQGNTELTRWCSQQHYSSSSLITNKTTVRVKLPAHFEDVQETHLTRCTHQVLRTVIQPQRERREGIYQVLQLYFSHPGCLVTYADINNN